MRLETRGDTECHEALGLPRAARTLASGTHACPSEATRHDVASGAAGPDLPLADARSVALSPPSSPTKSPGRSSQNAAAKTVYTLLEQMERRHALRPAFDELLQALGSKARRLVDEVKGDGRRFEAITDGYSARLMMRLLAMDKTGHKLEEIQERLDQLQYYDLEHKRLVPLVRNDWTHQDRVQRQISARCVAGRDPPNDPFYLECSGVRKRGRRRKEEKRDDDEAPEEPEEFDAVEAINRLYIVPKRASDDKKALLDMAQAFQQCLEVVNQQSPKTTNHGWHLETLLHLMRKLDGDDHTWHALLLLLNNMEYCVSYKRLALRFDTQQERLYCCVSGAEFSPGEEAHCLTFVERDAERDKAWKDYKLVEARVFEKPEFRRSVRTLLFKLELEGPVTLFPGKRQAAPLAAHERKKAKRSPTSLQWELMGVLQATLEKRPAMRYRAWEYALERRQVTAVLAALKDQQAAVGVLDKLMQYYAQSSHDAPWDAQALADEKRALFECVLDWIDTLQLSEPQPHPLLACLQARAQKRAAHVCVLLDARHPYLLLFVFLYQLVRDPRRTRKWSAVEAPDVLAAMGLV